MKLCMRMAGLPDPYWRPAIGNGPCRFGNGVYFPCSAIMFQRFMLGV